jgi:2,5-diketo-D-gluconate reductase B
MEIESFSSMGFVSPMDMKNIELTDGRTIPALGFGTWQLTGEECLDGVRDALDAGYRHIDTAQFYDNEAEVGRALSDSDVDREDVFLTTKIWWEHESKESASRSIDDSLKRLGTDRVDLLMLHWPRPDGANAPILEAMLDAQASGKAGLLGVCNFTPELLDDALAVAPVACNQVEYHPFLSQDRVLAACRERGLWVTAYSPLARGKVAGHPTLTQIGLLKEKTPAQIALRWLLDQDGIAAIPKSSSPVRRRENLALDDVALTDNDRATVQYLSRRRERQIDPDWAPRWEPASETVNA